MGIRIGSFPVKNEQEVPSARVGAISLSLREEAQIRKVGLGGSGERSVCWSDAYTCPAGD